MRERIHLRASRITSSRFVRHVAGLTGAAAIAQATAVIATPVLTRLFEPSDFGVLAVFGSIVAVSGVLATLRYESAIPLPQDEREAWAVLDLALGLSIMVALLALVIVIVFGREAVEAFSSPGLERLMWLVPPATLLTGTYASFTLWATRTQEYAAIAKTKVTRATTTVGIQIVLGLASVGGPLGLGIGVVAGQAVGIAPLARRAPLREMTRRGLQQRALEAWSAAIRYRRFPLMSAPSAFLNTLTLHAPAALIAAAYGPTIAGLFAIAQRVLGVPMGFVGSAIGEVFMGDAAAAHRSGELHRVLRLFQRTFLVLTFASAVLVGSVTAAAPWLATTVLGDDWGEAGAYMRALAPMFAMALIAAPFGSVLAILERQDLYLMRELLRATLIIGTLLWATKTGMPSMVAMVALGLAGAAGYCVYIALSWHALVRAARGKPKQGGI